jgi:hypothetical protein
MVRTPLIKLKPSSCLAVIRQLLMIAYIMLRIYILLQMYVMVN